MVDRRRASNAVEDRRKSVAAEEQPQASEDGWGDEAGRLEAVCRIEGRFYNEGVAQHLDGDINERKTDGTDWRL